MHGSDDRKITGFALGKRNEFPMGVQTILGGEESETSRSEILSQRDSKQRTQPTAFRLMSPRGKMSHYVAPDRRFCRLLACCFWLFQQRFYYFDPLCGFIWQWPIGWYYTQFWSQVLSWLCTIQHQRTFSSNLAGKKHAKKKQTNKKHIKQTVLKI